MYFYASNGEEFFVRKFDCDADDATWETVESDEIYAPTVYVHCHRTGLSSFTGTQFEGFNLIGNSYKKEINVVDSNYNIISKEIIGDRFFLNHSS